MLFTPTTNGIFAATQFVPFIDAVPYEPARDHLTYATPVAPVMVPEREIEASAVVAGGAFTVSASPDGILSWRVTVTARYTFPVASVAVNVMLLNPMFSGMPAVVQFVPLTEAAPYSPALVAQDTARVPLPPVTVPESEIDAAVVSDAEAFTVSVSGASGGPVVCVRAAYSVNMESLSRCASVDVSL